MLKYTVQDDRPKSIRRIGLTLAIFSAFSILNNTLRLFVYVSSGGLALENSDGQYVSAIHFLTTHYFETRILFLLIGIAFFIGGIGLRKYLGWSNKLVTLASTFALLYITIFMLATLSALSEWEEIEPLYLFGFSLGLIGTVPFGLLVWYLNRKKTLKHFTQHHQQKIG